MRNKFFLCMPYAVLTVLLATAVAGAIDRPNRVPDIIGYNVLAERTFKGFVASGGHNSGGLMYFLLQRGDVTLEVQIGPKEFVERRGFKLKAGEEVTVIGMPVIIRGQQVVLAREVRSMNGILIVRDEVGLPLWEGTRPLLMDPDHRKSSFDQCELIP